MSIGSISNINNLVANPLQNSAMQTSTVEIPAPELPQESFTPTGKDFIITGADPSRLSELKAQILSNPHNQITADLPIIGGFSVTLEDGDEEALMQLDLAKREGIIGNFCADAPLDFTSDCMIECGTDNGDVQVGKEANIMFGVDKLHEQGITGKGSCICVLDSGIAPHPDLKDRIIAFKDYVNGETEPYDDNGHGTHCAGICAGDGTSSDGKNVGVAPEANIIGVKVLDKFGEGSTSNIIKGIQWAIMNKHKYGIDVLSISLGRPIERTRFLDPMTIAVQVAYRAGLSVVVSAGNEGNNPETISSPANAPNAITVGALDDAGTPETSDDWVAYFSSQGPTKFDHLDKPDVVAPGVDIISCSHEGDGYVKMSGTSMATPFTAGLAALMKQVDPKIKPKQIKKVLMETANPIEYCRQQAQGAGVVDPLESIAKVSEGKRS